MDIDDTENIVITTKVGNIPKAKVRFNADIEPEEGDTYSADMTYTSNGSSGSETVYDGSIEDVEYLKKREVHVESNANELVEIRPKVTDYNLYNVLIRSLQECDYVSINGTTFSGDYAEFYSTYLRDDVGTTGTDIDFVDDATDSSPEIVNVGERHKVLELDSSSVTREHSSTQADDVYEFWTYINEKTNIYIMVYEGNDHVSTGDDIILNLNIFHNKIDNLDLNWDKVNEISYDNYEWVHWRIEFDDSENTLNIYRNLTLILEDVDYLNDTSTGPDDYLIGSTVYDGEGGTGYIDAIGFPERDENYDKGDNLYIESNIPKPSTGHSQKISIDGETTILRILDKYTKSQNYGWYLENDLTLKIGNLDTYSGIIISKEDSPWNILGKKQLKDVSRVILLGGFVNGERVRVTSGSGRPIFKDTYSSIVDEDTLQDIADNILANKQEYPLTIQLNYRNDSEGMLQVGETVYIGGHYSATYSFGPKGSEDSDDEVGDTNEDITFVDVLHDGNLEIVEEIDKHRNVLESAGDSVDFYDSIGSEEYGIVEWYEKFDSSNVSNSEKRELSSLHGANIFTYFDGDEWRVDDGSSTYLIEDGIDFSDWHHFKIDFNCEEEIFDCYLDGILVGEFTSTHYETIGDYIARFRFTYNTKGWVDAVGYTWESYEEGDNLTDYNYLTFQGSDKSVPTGSYIIWKIEYDYLREINTLVLKDGLDFVEEKTTAEQNSELTRQNSSDLSEHESETLADGVHEYYPAVALMTTESNKSGTGIIGWEDIEVETDPDVIEADPSNNKIIIKKPGVYEIRFEGVSRTGNDTRGEIGAEFRKNGNGITHSRSWSYARIQYKDKTTSTCSWIEEKTDDEEDDWQVNVFNEDGSTYYFSYTLRFWIKRL